MPRARAVTIGASVSGFKVTPLILDIPVLVCYHILGIFKKGGIATGAYIVDRSGYAGREAGESSGKEIGK